MRNLKRVLSLALASVMLMGMMVMGASAADKTAADLTDMDKVTNKAAVSLLVDLGIIVGKPDGTYAPAEIVNRATMAKLITYIVMGDVDPSAFTGTTTDLKDVNGHWAEGYIKYCYANGYIVGDGQGHFMPDQPVTTVSAAKMLLVALGYDAKDRGYEGDSSWSVNIMKDAQKMELLTSLSVKASDNLSRDNAAQIIFNALFAQTVQNDYSRDINGNKYVSKVTVTTAPADKLGFITYGLTKVTGVLVANEYAGLDASKSAKGYSKIKVGTAPVSTVKIGSTTDLLGHQVVYYTDNNAKLISTSLVDSGKTKVYTDNTPAKANNSFVKDNDLDLAGVAYSTNYGTAGGTAWTATAGDTALYINTDGTGAVEYAVLVSYTFGKVTAVDSAKGTLTVTGAFGTKKVADVTGADKVAKDDYVVYATVGGETTIEKAATVTGTVSRKSGSSTITLTVDGTAYTVAPAGSHGAVSTDSRVKEAATYASALDVSKASEQTFVLNKGGLIVLVVGKEDAASKYAYIEAFKISTDSWDSTKKTVEVKAVLSDGTQETYVLVDDNSTADTSSLKETAIAAAAATPSTIDTKKGVYKYTLDTDGKMVIKDADKITTSGTAAFKTGKPSLTSSVFVDASTVVLYVYTKDDKTQSASYTGIDNIPNLSGSIIYSKKSATSDFAEFVFVNAAPEKAQSVAKYAYAYTSSTAEVAKGKEVKVVIDGAIETLIIGKTATVTANKMYTYTTDSDGISTLTEVSADGVYTYTKISTVGSNYIIAGGNVIYLDKDATIDDLTSFNDDGKLEPAKGTLAKDVTIVYAKVGGSGSNKDDIAKAYIVPVPVAGTVTIENIDGTLYATISGFEGGEVSYQWKKDATTNVGTDSDSYKPTASGSYTVVVTVTSQLDSTKTANATSSALSVTVS